MTHMANIVPGEGCQAPRTPIPKRQQGGLAPFVPSAEPTHLGLVSGSNLDPPLGRGFVSLLFLVRTMSWHLIHCGALWGLGLGLSSTGLQNLQFRRLLIGSKLTLMSQGQT